MNQINVNDKYHNHNNPQFKSEDSKKMPYQPQMPQGYPNNFVLPQIRQQKVELPYIYRVPNEENKKDGFLKTMFKTIFGSAMEHPLMFAGAFLGASWGADKVAEKFGGEYSKSWLGKAANAGDKLEQSKFVQSKPMQSIIGLFKKGGEKVKSTLGQTDIIRAMKETPCSPELVMAKGEVLGVDQRILHEEFSNIARTLELTTENPIEFGKIKPNKAEKEMLKKLFKVSNISELSESEATNAILLKRLKEKHLTDDVIRSIARSDESSAKTKLEMLKSMGLTPQKASQILADEKCEMVDDIYKALEKSKGKIKADGCYKKWLGPFQIFSREIGTDQAFNRLHSIKNGAKTNTGRFFSKAVQRLHRCLTFGGGKIGILLFIAPHLVHTIKSTIKAEPKEKIGTAVGGTLGMGLWILTMPITTKLIYALGGIKHAGMGVKKVKENENLIKQFNESVFDNYGSYKTAKKNLKKKLKANKVVNNQSLGTKIARKIAGFFTCDLNMIKPYKVEGQVFANTLRGFGNTAKNVLNVPIRFLVFMAISGKFDDLILKGISLIFGKAHDITIDEEHEEAKKQQRIYTKEDLNNRMLELQKAKMTGIQPKEDLTEQEKILDKMASEVEGTGTNKRPKKQTNKPRIEQPVEERYPQTSTTRPLTEAPKETPVNEKAAIANKIPTETKTEPVKPVIEKTEPVAEQKQPVVKPETENIQPTVQQKQEPKLIVPAVPAKPIAQNVSVQTPKTDNYTYIPSSTQKIARASTVKRDNYTYIPSSENVLKKEENDFNVKKYVPSQIGANITKSFDNSGLSSALQRADKAEQKAIEILNGKFN